MHSNHQSLCLLMNLLIALWFSADLANLVNEAALLAGRASKLVVEKEDFSRAVERSVAVRGSKIPPILRMPSYQFFP